jgi:hypothetical protein
MSFFGRVVCRQRRTSISGEGITGPMNRRINANTKSVQNARVEERQQKIFSNIKPIGTPVSCRLQEPGRVTGESEIKHTLREIVYVF